MNARPRSTPAAEAGASSSTYSADDEPSTRIIEPSTSRERDDERDGTRIIEPLAARQRRLSAPPPEPPTPTRVGRFTIIRQIGKGGMGVVYAAFDEELDRKVALKLLNVGLDRGSMGPERMRREAQAMARLSHPNVAQVYDVGRHEGSLYIAMEFIDGLTLRAWLRERERTLRERIDMLIQAGRGLAAAHAAGLTHRDFKPDNVLVGRDGRVRVLDFGLASISRDGAGEPSAPRELEGAAHAEESTSARVSGVSVIERSLTVEGTLVGTPAYMSPEQYRHEAVDPLSDQFSFFVALHEALYGVRPFRGRSLRSLAAQACSGAVVEPPTNARVPSWLRRVILRGLQPARADRWPSMDIALTQLARDPARARRRALTLGGGALAIAATSYAAVALPGQGLRACAGAERKLSGVWDDARRERMSQAVTALGGDMVVETWPKISSALDDYASGWAEMHRAACEATARGEQSARLLDLRMRCLDDRRAALEAFVDVIDEADVEAVAKLVVAAYQLPSLDRCAESSALLAAVPPPTESARAAVAKSRELLTRARPLHHAGRFEEVLALADEARAGVEGLEYPPALAEVELLRGRARLELGRYADARELLLDAWWAATRSAYDDVALEAAFELTFVTSAHLAEPEEARLWLGNADALVERTRAGDHARARLGKLRAELATSASDHEAAMAAFERALALHEAHAGDPEWMVSHASLENALGSSLHGRGELDSAAPHYLRAIELYERALGTTHPKVAAAQHNLGLLLMRRGHDEDARARIELAVSLWERGLGPEHPKVALGLNTLGLLLNAEGRDDEAEETLERALAIREKTLGPAHPLVASPLTNLGGMALARGDLTRAQTRLERALEIRERSLGREHPKLLWTLQGLGQLHRVRGDHESSRAQLERAVAISESRNGEDHPRTAALLIELAETELAAERPSVAREQLERALQIHSARGWSSPMDRARHHYRLARALVDVTATPKADRARARELVATARELLRALQSREGEQLDSEVQGLLADLDALAGRLGP